MPFCLIAVSLKLTASGHRTGPVPFTWLTTCTHRAPGVYLPLEDFMTSSDGSRIACINVCLEHAGRGYCKSSCNAQASGTMRSSYNTCLAGKLALGSTEKENFSSYLLLSKVTEGCERSWEPPRGWRWAEIFSWW